MARIREIVIDAVNPAALAHFWASALDGYAVRPYDAAELARLAALGLSPETDPAVAVDGPGPILFLQKVTEKKVARNRVHLDLVGGPRHEEVARLRALGARRSRPRGAQYLHRHARPRRERVLRPGSRLATRHDGRE